MCQPLHLRTRSLLYLIGDMDSTTLGWFPQFLELSKEYILTDPSLMWGLPLFHTPFLSLPTVENGPMRPYGVPWRNINCGISFSFFLAFSYFLLFFFPYFGRHYFASSQSLSANTHYINYFPFPLLFCDHPSHAIEHHIRTAMLTHWLMWIPS